MENYRVVRSLKSALYGDVVLAKDLQTQEVVAIKRVRLSNALRKQSLNGTRIKEDAEAERQAMKILSKEGGHPNVLRLLSEFTENGFLYLVLEYCGKGELYGLIEEAPNQRFSEDQARTWFHQIVSGVRYIHEQGIAHRDISLENVLVDDEDICKVCDFGLSATTSKKHSDSVGKFFYMSPETYTSQEYEATVADVWSLGIVLFIMLTGVPPMELPSVQDDRFRLMKSSGAKALLRAWKMNTWFSSDAMDLLNKMLVVEPSRRPSVDDILNHPWFFGKKPVPSRAAMAVIQQSSRQGKYPSFEDDNVLQAIAEVSLDAQNPVANKKQKILRSIEQVQHNGKLQEQVYVQQAESKEANVRKPTGSSANQNLNDNLLNKTVLGHLRNRVESAKLWEAYQEKRALLKEAWKSSCPWNPVA